MSSEWPEQAPMIAVVDAMCDVEGTEKPFGKRWAEQRIQLKEEHLAALRNGKLLALDVNEEYVVFLEMEKGG